jgi:hypothetical protein
MTKSNIGSASPHQDTERIKREAVLEIARLSVPPRKFQSIKAIVENAIDKAAK